MERLNDAARYVDPEGKTLNAQTVVSLPPTKLLTLGDADHTRLRVDVAQTSFFDGREWRAFYEVNIPSGQSRVVRAVVGVDSVLFGVDLSLIQSEIRLETFAGGSESGTFNVAVPTFRRNNMTTAPVRVSQNALTTGAAAGHTGGTLLDVLLVRAGTANLNKVASVGASLADERGIAPGTYYFVLINTDGADAIGVFNLRWEERP